MNPILFIALSMTACAIAHYSVVFLEPSKASWFKAMALGVFTVVGSNVARWNGFSAAPILEWMVYIVVTGGFVWALYKLKPLNNLTVGACYVAGSYLLVHAIHLKLGAFSA
jgi:hypothetical protein